MTHTEMLDLLTADISEHKFEIRAKARSLRGHLDALMAALDEDRRPIFVSFTSQAAEIERELARVETRAGILALLQAEEAKNAR